jgi:phosphohistidine phosphatase SixA
LISMRAIILLSCLSLFIAPWLPGAANGEEGGTADRAWQALRAGGHVAIMRHALAPGFSDPAGFRLDDCTTQRNLSAQGRRQAKAIGDAFRGNGVEVDAVYSSQWCRCLETAELLGFAPVAELPELNSFFENRDRAEPQLAALRGWLGKTKPHGAIVLVTHQVVVSGLVGGFPASGEIVVFRPDGENGIEVVGRITPPSTNNP